MPMYFGSRDGLKPRCDFTEEEARRLIGYTTAEEIGEPTEYIDEVLSIVDEALLDAKDGSEHPVIFEWEFETTGHLWKYDVRVHNAPGEYAEQELQSFDFHDSLREKNISSAFCIYLCASVSICGRICISCCSVPLRISSVSPC